MVLLAVMLAASVAEAAFPVTLVDDAGRKLTLDAKPSRIVSTAPSNTEALFALGAGDRVVGVTTFCVDPPEARTRAKVGDFSSLDFERVVALEPDLVVATWLEQRRHVEKMEGLGLKVLVLYPTSIEGTMRSLEILGRATGAEERAAALVAGMRRRLGAIDEKVKALPELDRPTVFVELGASPLYTAGPGSTVDEVVVRAGGRNVAHDLGKPYATISREVVLARDPDFVIVGMGGAKGEAARAFAGLAGFARLRAVREGRVHDEIDPAVLFHQNERLVDGVEAVFALLHGKQASR